MSLRALGLTLPLLLLLDAGGCYTGCPQSKHEFCGERNCGVVTEENACGEVQSIRCGECYGPDLCGGKGVPNVCSFCTPPSQVVERCTGGWCKIPAGCFVMGTSRNRCSKLVVPSTGFGPETAHEVALTHSFELSDSEVTQHDFMTLVGYNPSRNWNQPGRHMPQHPVEYVSWHEAAAYANARSRSQGKETCYACSGDKSHVRCAAEKRFEESGIYDCQGFRLPTEAEWEYAFRAAKQLETSPDRVSDFYAGLAIASDAECCFEGPTCARRTSRHAFLGALWAHAWFGPNAGQTHHAVRTKKKNPWGLYDLAGNVFEWCHDWAASDLGKDKTVDPAGLSTGSVKAVRSAGYEWRDPAFFRAAARRLEKAEHVCHSVGFRLARTLQRGPI